jgi:RNA polymerase sigma-70 factor (ECF subfamily)
MVRDEAHEETLKNLARQCLQGDRQAFAEIYDQTFEDVRRTVFFLFGQHQEAEDLLHDIYVEAYKSLAKYDPNRPFTTWLIGLAIRQINHYRRKTWFRWRLADRINRWTGNTAQPDIANDVIERMHQHDQLAKIMALPYKYKSIVILKYLYEYSQEEIAQILDIPVGTVKSRLNYALSKAREKLAKESPILTVKEG